MTYAFYLGLPSAYPLPARTHTFLFIPRCLLLLPFVPVARFTHHCRTPHVPHLPVTHVSYTGYGRDPTPPLHIVPVVTCPTHLQLPDVHLFCTQPDGPFITLLDHIDRTYLLTTTRLLGVVIPVTTVLAPPAFRGPDCPVGPAGSGIYLHSHSIADYITARLRYPRCRT